MRDPGLLFAQGTLILILGQESQNGLIDLPEDDPDVIGHLITFLYTSVYPTKTASQYLLDVKLYTVADKYDVPRLKSAAKRSFTERAVRVFKKAKEASEKTSEDHSKIQKELCNIIGCIPMIYEATPDSDRGLRAVITIQAKYYGTLLREAPYKEKCQQLVQQVPAFGWDLLSLYMQQNSERVQSGVSDEPVT